MREGSAAALNLRQEKRESLAGRLRADLRSVFAMRKLTRRMRAWLGGALAAGSVMSGAAAADSEFRLTESAEGVYLAGATIAGVEGLLVFDTGAEITALEPEFAERASLHLTENARRLHGLTNVEWAGLATVDILVGPIRGDQSETAVLREALPFPVEADGVLGLDLIVPEPGSVIELDFPDRTVRIHGRRNAPEPMFHPPWLELTPIADRDVLAVPIRADRVEGTAIIDTGIPFVVMNRAMQQSLNARGQLSYVEIKGFDDTEESLPKIAVIRSLQLGATRLQNVRAYVIDAPALALLGLEDEPTLIMGAAAFSGLTILFDPDHRRIAAAPPEYFSRPGGRNCTGSRLSCTGRGISIRSGG